MKSDVRFLAPWIWPNLWVVWPIEFEGCEFCQFELRPQEALHTYALTLGTMLSSLRISLGNLTGWCGFVVPIVSVDSQSPPETKLLSWEASWMNSGTERQLNWAQLKLLTNLQKYELNNDCCLAIKIWGVLLHGENESPSLSLIQVAHYNDFHWFSWFLLQVWPGGDFQTLWFPFLSV